MKKNQLDDLLEKLPSAPGVYLMKGAGDRVIYVGKAKNLKNRVRQYFTPGTSDTRFFVKDLRTRITGIDTVITNTEKEALLLEYNLIQRHLPRYNIRLTDDKNFLCLRLDRNARWPRLEIVRRTRKDKALYFGPYHSATSARELVRLINRHFKLRKCRDSAFANRSRPCLQHQIHRCLAPCVFPVDRDEYMNQVTYVQLFLEGRRDDLLSTLEASMTEAAESMEYERAGVLRDQIRAVRETLASQQVTELRDLDRDVVGLHRQGDQVQLVILEIVDGRLVNMRTFFFKGQEFPNEDLLSSFLVQHYTGGIRFPDEIVVPVPLSDDGSLGDLFGEERGSRVRVICPRRGKRLDQLEMARRNAEQVFAAQAREKEDLEVRLQFVQDKLKLKTLPRHIECVDIAHFSGQNTVGAISAVWDGQVNKRQGRLYRVREAASGDDYRAIHEVLKRRFLRARKEEPGWEAPDLLVVDGGKGQLAIARAALKDLGIENQEMVGLAKERSALTDRVFLVGRANPIPVRADTSPLFLLAMARDEAHRLANGFQAKSRRQHTVASALDQVPGVGPGIRRALLRHFGSVKRVRSASAEELIRVSGVGPELANRIVSFFRGET